MGRGGSGKGGGGGWRGGGQSWGGGGQSWSGGGQSWGGGGSRGGDGGHKPFWRRFVDASDDPVVIEWCHRQIAEFMASGEAQWNYTWMANDRRNTLRAEAPKMGCGFIKVEKGVWALVRGSDEEDPSKLKAQLVDVLVQYVKQNGGRVRAKEAMWAWSAELTASAQQFQIRKPPDVMSVCRLEVGAAGLRLSNNEKNFFVGDDHGYDDVVHITFDKASVHEAREALQRAVTGLPKTTERANKFYGGGFLEQGFTPMSAEKLQQEQGLRGYIDMLPARQRLPAFQRGKEICAAVASQQVTLILGATGCGKTTQIPQLVMEDAIMRGEECRVLASQPRRISAVSVAERVAVERGGALGDTVAFKIRFEDTVKETSQLVFCTVGILLKIMQGNPTLEGATHIIVDEVHERDLHTDFLLTLLRRVLKQRPELKLILMSATVDPSAFQAYFPGAQTVQIPGKTNYPIRELFIEDLLMEMPAELQGNISGQTPRRGGRSSSSWKTRSFKALEGLPTDAQAVSAALPRLPRDIAAFVAEYHTTPAEDIDYGIATAIVEMIEDGGEEGAVLIFMPGWGEILEMMKRLQACRCAAQLQVLPLHSRLSTSEQQAIFALPPAGKRKVVIATILAETSITIEDVVFVIDSGRSRSTFFDEKSLISALKTVWYSKANGFQRRGRAGRCRPGVWYKLFTSLQWDAMDEYELPEMLRSPLEELCLEVAMLRLGAPREFLVECISPPKDTVVHYAVELLWDLGAVTDKNGATVTPLGEKLATLQVHPMLAKMLLVGGMFQCFQPILTICAALGYKSPFVCPMGKEKEANAAKLWMADESHSDHLALCHAFEGWTASRNPWGFASQNFLSGHTMEYLKKLRGDLEASAKELLRTVPTDHEDKLYLHDVCRAVLVAGLFPRLAQISRRGKGWTMDGLRVEVHPGSVNKFAQNCVVAYYDLQETTSCYLYDTTIVGMAPVLLFAPSLQEVYSSKSVVIFEIQSWRISVATEVANDIIALRDALSQFMVSSVGKAPTQAHIEAANALSRLFSERAGVLSGSFGEDDEDEDGAGSGGGSPAAAASGAAASAEAGGAGSSRGARRQGEAINPFPAEWNSSAAASWKKPRKGK